MPSILRAALRWFNLHPLWRRDTVPVWGSRLRAPTADRWLALRLHQFRRMGVDDEKFLRAHVKSGMTVLDIGANQGLYSLCLARFAGPAGKVVAFEPDPLLFEALERNIALNRAATIQAHHVALGSIGGAMTLHRSLVNSGDNRLAAKAENAGLREGVKIRVERLDELLADESIDFVKMDVQGWELEVFRGMQGLLDAPQNAALTIYFEFWPRGLRDAGAEPAETLRFLIANGFVLHRTSGGELGGPEHDPAALAASLEGNAYTNLCGMRGRNHTVNPGSI